MPEIGSSGLMSGDGKRGVGHRPQATAPILDSTKPEVGACATRRLIVPNSDCCKISTLFGGSDASQVNTSVRGEVVDLAARDTDIH
jgi:hypothetical protein